MTLWFRRQFRIAAALIVLMAPTLHADVPALSEVYALYSEGKFEVAQTKLAAYARGLDPEQPGYAAIMARVRWQEAQLFLALGLFPESLDKADASVAHAQQAKMQQDVLAAIYQGERGKVLMKLGYVERALQDLRRAREFLETEDGLQSIMWDMRRYEAMMLSELGMIDEAEHAFTEMVAAHQKTGDRSALTTALLDLAGAKLRGDTKGVAQAEDALELVHEAEALLSPKDLGLWGDVKVLRGRIALQRSDLELANTLFAQATKFFDDPVRIAYARGLQAQVNVLKGDAQRAERLYTASVRDIHQQFGALHPMLARTLVGLGLVNAELGRPSDAISYLSRAVRVFEDGVGIGTTAAAEARVELAMIFNQVGEYTNAKSVAAAALEDLEESPSALRRAFARSAYAFALAGRAETMAAQDNFEIALAEITRLRGPDSSDLVPGLIQMAKLKALAEQEHRHEANAYFYLNEAWRILRKDAATGPRLTATAFTTELELLFHFGERRAAASRARDAVQYLKAQLQPSEAACDARSTEVVAHHRLLTTAMDVLAWTEAHTERLFEELFDAAQLAHAGSSSQAILQVASQRNGDAKTEALLRERRVLHAERCALEHALLNSLSGTSGTAEIDRISTEDRIESLAQQLVEIDRELAPMSKEQGAPLSGVSQDIAMHLGSNESMLVQVTGAQASHLFWLDATGLRYRSTSLATAALSGHARRLRSSIEVATVKKGESLPPVPLAPAHALYKGIFAPFEAFMQMTDIIHFVADGAVRSLPPAMFLTRDYGNVSISDPQVLKSLDWLGAVQAISVTPSPVAFVALRAQFAASDGTVDFVGIGNPAFAKPRYALPDTEQELNKLSKQFSPENNAVLSLGANATEAWVRTSTAVREARVLTFATHGLLNRELGVAEPALMLARPATGLSEADWSETDDGFLTASEIATLELKADWVILSACNTAAGRDARAEGLSGLARSFFQAGARSLMVSHWYVPSSAAGALTVFTAQAINEHGIGRSVALKEAMRRVRNGETLDGTFNSRFGHPAYWATFVIVGEAR